MDKLRLVAERLIREEKMEGEAFRRLMEGEAEPDAPAAE